MAAYIDKKRTHGKIDSLPEELRGKVEEMLLAGTTYEEISEWLKEAGYDIHYSSVFRFGRPFIKKYEGVRLAREFAKLMAEDNPDRPSTELHEANNVIASQILMEVIVDDEKTVDEKMKALKMVASLQQAQVQNERLKVYARKDMGAVRVAMGMLKDRVFREIQSNYPDVAALMVQIADEIAKEMENA